MSDRCRNCRYDVRSKTGSDACPFDYLYWIFLIENEKALGDNPRMKMVYRNLSRPSDAQRADIVAESKRFLDGPPTTRA